MNGKCRFEILKGPSGVGKTAVMVSGVMKDLTAGRRVLFIVPDQTSATAERAISYECQKKGVPRQRLEILSFTRLANSFFIKYGGAQGIGLPKTERRLHLWRAFRELGPDMLGCFSSMAGRAEKFVPIIGDLVDEMKKSGVSPETLEKCGDSGSEGFGKKLRDISVIYSAYNRRLESAGITDPSDGVARFAAAAKEHGEFFDGVSVYMDGFVRFSKPELDVIREMLRRGSSLTVSLCCEDGREYVFGTVSGNDPGSAEKKLLSVAADAGVDPVVTVRERSIPTKEECSPGIYDLKTKFCSDISGDGANPDGVRFFMLPNVYSEAEFAACEIIRAIRKDGAKCSDFTVVAGDARAASLISVTLNRHGIPNHVSARRELRETRLFRFVISALSVAGYGWRREDVLTFVKTGLTGLDNDEVCELENYVNLWEIRGAGEWRRKWEMSPAGFSEMDPDAETRRKLSDALSGINASRERVFTGLDRFCSDLKRGGTLRDACLAMYDLLHVSFGVDKNIENMPDPAEDVRLWNVLCSVLDSVNRTSGDVRSDSGAGLAGVFAEAFEIAMAGASAGSVPVMSDEVTVAVFGAHTPHTPRAIITGCNYGSLPPAPQSGTILTDEERGRILDKDGIEIGIPPKDRYCLDNLDFYLCLCIPSKDILLTCSKYSPTGEKIAPSEQFESARSIFLSEDEREEERKDGKRYVSPGPLDYVWDDVSAREKMRLLRGTVEGSSLAEALGMTEKEDVPLRADENSSVDPAAVAALLVKDSDGMKTMGISPSAIDQYVGCPLRYTLSREAGLSAPPDVDDAKAASDGTLIHHVLEKYFSGEYARDKEHTMAEFSDFAEKNIEEMLRNVIPAGSRDVLSSARAYGVENLKKTAGTVLSVLDGRQKESHFEPKYFEYKMTGEKPQAEVGDVGVRVYGTADRIDVYDDAESGKRYFRVIDYKSSGQEFSAKGLAKGEKLQMFLYLYGITEDEGEAPCRDAVENGLKPAPAAVTYYTVKPGRPERKNGQTYYDAVKGALKIEGVFDGEIRSAFESGISGKDVNNKTGLTEFGGVSRRGGGQLCGDYEEVRATVKEQVARVCEGILSGDAGARPKKDSGKSPCEFCDFKAACRSRRIRGADEAEDEEGGDENE